MRGGDLFNPSTWSIFGNKETTQTPPAAPTNAAAPDPAVAPSMTGGKKTRSRGRK